MAAHKAATAVSLAPVAEKSGIALLVERYWKLAAVLAIAAAGLVLYREYRRSEAKVENDRAWDQLVAIAPPDLGTRRLRGDPARIEDVAAQVRGSEAGPWALYVAATSAADDRDFESAAKAISQLKAQHPDHPLCSEAVSVPGEEGLRPLVEHLERRLQAQAEWKSANPTLFSNPDPAPDTPRVRLRTDRGDIVLALYPDKAPQHCENFLKLAREGYYTGTKFHRTSAGLLVEGGDPNTIQGDPATWGQGGPDYKIPREESGLRHFEGYLSAVKKDSESESSGSQFCITIGAAHHLDGKRVVYGKVVEGLDVVRAIAELPIAAGTTDRPESPVGITAAEVVQN